MRRSIYFFLIFFLLCSNSYAQTTPSDKELMDSLLKHDEMLKMIDNYDNASSYFRINVGLGNKLYSDENKAIETLQNNNPFIISPSIAYNNKSGLGISFTGFLFNQNRRTEFYQYSLSPFYSYTKSNDVNLILSYTHYFEKDKFSVYTSPTQNEFYGSILFKKGWLKPNVSVGYSSGKYYEIIKVDTIIKLPNRNVHLNFIDTTTTKLSSFSLTAGVQHSFSFYNLLSSKDAMVFTPQFSIITGINKYRVSNTKTSSEYPAITKRLQKRIRNYQSQTDKNNYMLQSLGLDLDISYGIGKIYFGPELYLNYYLPSTTDKRLTQIFNFNIGITF
jgi:hypothetical protein